MIAGREEGDMQTCHYNKLTSLPLVGRVTDNIIPLLLRKNRQRKGPVKYIVSDIFVLPTLKNP